MNKMRLSIAYIRELPFIGVGFSVLHMTILLMAGYRYDGVVPDYIGNKMYIISFEVEKIWSVLLLAGFLTVSKEFGFCRLHRIAIIHLFMTYACYDYQRLIGFGDMIVAVRVAILVIGLCILIRFITTREWCIKEKDEA